MPMPMRDGGLRTIVAPALFDCARVVFVRPSRKSIPLNVAVARTTRRGKNRHADAIPLLPTAIVRDRSDDLGQIEISVRHFTTGPREPPWRIRIGRPEPSMRNTPELA